MCNRIKERSQKRTKILMVFMTRSNNSEIDFFLTRMADRVICRDSDSMREFEYISYVNGH